MAVAVSVVLAALELAALPTLAERRPAVWVGARAGSGVAGALAGKDGRLYRLQPEVVMGLRPRDRLELYAGAGLGPVILVRSNGREIGTSASGVLALRVLLRGGETVSFLARAEGVGGGGAAVSFDVRVSFAP